MGEVIHFRSKAEGKTLQQLLTGGMTDERAAVCAQLLVDVNAIGLATPFTRGGYNGGFLMLWITPEHSVAIEAPNKGGEMWSIHHHDKRAELKPCYEIQFTYVGDNKGLAKAVKEIIDPVTA